MEKSIFAFFLTDAHNDRLEYERCGLTDEEIRILEGES